VSAVTNGPMLTQQSSGTWTTTVVLDASAVCVSNLTYELVTTPPGRPVNGTIDGRHPIQGTAAPINCHSPTAEDEEVTVAFHLSSVPLAATLVMWTGVLRTRLHRQRYR
jgi:hypothetical protein